MLMLDDVSDNYCIVYAIDQRPNLGNDEAVLCSILMIIRNGRRFIRFCENEKINEET